MCDSNESASSFDRLSPFERTIAERIADFRYFSRREGALTTRHGLGNPAAIGSRGRQKAIQGCADDLERDLMAELAEELRERVSAEIRAVADRRFEKQQAREAEMERARGD